MARHWRTDGINVEGYDQITGEIKERAWLVAQQYVGIDWRFSRTLIVIDHREYLAIAGTNSRMSLWLNGNVSLQDLSEKSPKDWFLNAIDELVSIAVAKQLVEQIEGKHGKTN